MISRVLWRDLRAEPPSQWRYWMTASRAPWSMILAFALSGVALVSGVLLAALVAYRAADAGARAREAGRFDFLAVTPGGAAGAAYDLARAVLHHQITWRTLNALRWTAAVIVIGVGVLAVGWLAQGDDARAQADAIDLGLFLLFYGPMLLLDHRYAILHGVAAGMLRPLNTAFDPRALAILDVTLLHLGGYLMAGLAGGLIVPTAYRALGIGGTLADLTIPLLALVAFALYHEAAAALLHRAAQVRLADAPLITTPQEA